MTRFIFIILFLFSFVSFAHEQIPNSISPDCCFIKKDASGIMQKIPLKGKVKIVEHFADFKVQIVKNFADIKVKQVQNFPDDCGEWQYVDNFEDFSIEIVDNFPDFTITYVDNFPGL